MSRWRSHDLLALLLLAGSTLGVAACGGGEPTAPDPSRLSITAAGSVSTLSSGSTLQLTALLTSSTGAVLPLPALSWSSSSATTAGVSSTGLVTGLVVGTTTISATAVGVTASYSLSVTPGTPDHLAIRSQPVTASSGIPFGTQPVIEVRDARENVTPQASVTVTAAVQSGGGTLSGTSTAMSALGVATFSGLTLSGAIGARTLVFTATGFTAVAGGPLELGPGAPALLVVRTQPAGAASGAAFTTQPVIEARDANGNLVTGAVLNITVALQSGGGTLGGTTIAPMVNGVATFTGLSVSGIVGNRVLSFSAPTLATVPSGAFPLGAGAPALLVVRTQPAGAASGAAFTTQPVIEVRDASGNLATGAVLDITVALQSGGGTLGGTTIAPTVNGVATFTGLSVSGIVGDRVLSFSAPTLTTVPSGAFPLGAGAPAALSLTTPPVGGGLNGPFLVQPTVAVRDGAGNLATAGSVTVTASITVGGGSLTGATVSAVGGIAQFTALGITGTGGSRTLAFTVPGAVELPYTITPCDGVLAPRLALAASSAALVGVALGPVVNAQSLITDQVASCTAIAGLAPTVAYTAAATGWLTATVETSPTRLSLRADPAALPIGVHTATVTVGSANAGSATLLVSFDARAAFTVSYALESDKVRQLAIDSTLRVIPVVRDQTGATANPPLVFVSRSPSVATVTADGTITGRAGGSAWIVVRTDTPTAATDSLYVNVPATAGPLLRADITRVTYARNTGFSVTLVLDTRGATIGAADLLFTWPTERGTPSMLRLITVVPGTMGGPVITSDVGAGATRITIASVAGLSGVITLGRIDFTPVGLGSSQFVLRINELIDLSQVSLLDQSSSLRYPVVVR